MEYAFENTRNTNSQRRREVGRVLQAAFDTPDQSDRDAGFESLLRQLDPDYGAQARQPATPGWQRLALHRRRSM